MKRHAMRYDIVIEDDKSGYTVQEAGEKAVSDGFVLTSFREEFDGSLSSITAVKNCTALKIEDQLVFKSICFQAAALLEREKLEPWQKKALDGFMHMVTKQREKH